MIDPDSPAFRRKGQNSEGINLFSPCLPAKPREGYLSCEIQTWVAKMPSFLQLVSDSSPRCHCFRHNLRLMVMTQKRIMAQVWFKSWPSLQYVCISTFPWVPFFSHHFHAAPENLASNLVSVLQTDGGSRHVCVRVCACIRVCTQGVDSFFKMIWDSSQNDLKIFHETQQCALWLMTRLVGSLTQDSSRKMCLWHIPGRSRPTGWVTIHQHFKQAHTVQPSSTN